MTEAIADVSELYPKFRSKAERAWWDQCEAVLLAEFGKRVVRTDYEPVTFNLPGNKYTPDFFHIFYDGRILFVEVKGSKRQKNYRDARSKLRLAAAVFPCFGWMEVRRTRSGWDLERI